MALISVVVPIYNVERYLHRSIESLINQTLSDIEIILVNDGSTDDSLKICKQYSDIDDRIVIIDKPNGGVSSARNTGIIYATSKYISFVDPDDYVEEYMYENMYSKIVESESDICITNYVIETLDGSIYIKNDIEYDLYDKNEINNKIIIPIIAGEDITKVGKLTGFRSPWVFLYKTCIIKNSNIRFLEGLPIGEDFLFNLNYLSKSSKLAIDNGYYYHYCVNEESVTNKYINNYYEYHKILISNIEKTVKNYAINDRDLSDKLNERICIMKINYLIAGILNELHKCNKKSKKEKIKSINVLINDPLFEDALEEYNYNKLGFFRKLWFLILKKKRVYLIYMYYKLRV